MRPIYRYTGVGVIAMSVVAGIAAGLMDKGDVMAGCLFTAFMAAWFTLIGEM
jgi:hypothetical protein